MLFNPGGAVSFRFDYRLNGRRETLTVGRYGDSGITLAEARERAKKARVGKDKSREIAKALRNVLD